MRHQIRLERGIDDGGKSPLNIFLYNIEVEFGKGDRQKISF